MEQKDILISIFENLIHDNSFPNEKDAEFIDRVTFHYLHHLNSKGHIPYLHFHLVKEDIVEEVTEIYRKKTYGHFSLKSYRKSKVPQNFIEPEELLDLDPKIQDKRQRSNSKTSKTKV